MSSEHLTSAWLLQLLVVLLKPCLAPAGPAKPLNGTECRASGPASYILVFTGHWSQQAFPKQYPMFRPPAQWSKLVGERDCSGVVIVSPEIAYGSTVTPNNILNVTYLSLPMSSGRQGLIVRFLGQMVTMMR